MPTKKWKLKNIKLCNECPAFIHHKYINGGSYGCVFKYKIKLPKNILSDKIDRPDLCKLELGY